VRLVRSCEMLSGLLWRTCDSGTEWFETMDMMTLKTTAIQLINGIGPQVGIGCLGAQYVVNECQDFLGESSDGLLLATPTSHAVVEG